MLERGIARGAVPAGQQLPPERDLAAALKVSRATVVSAYRELEARGLVRGYVGRGTFVSATPDAASAPFAWRGKIAASALQANDTTTVRDLVRAAADPHLISVAAGVPALDCFPTEAFQRAMNHVLTTQGDAAWRHGPTEGLQRVPRRAGAPVRRRARAHPGPGRRAAGAGSAGALPDRSRRRGGHRSARLSRRDSDLPQRRRAAGRLGCHARRHRRARGAAAALSPEADLHQPDASEPDRRHPADSHAARDARAGRALPRADRRGRHLSRSRAHRAAASALAVRPRRGAHRRHSHQQLLEDAGARACVSAGSARCGRSSISWR